MLIQAINCIVTSPSVWNFKIRETSINLPVVIYRKMKVNKFMIWKNGLISWRANLLTLSNLTHLHDKNDKTHLIHRPINICDTSLIRLIKGSLSFLSLILIWTVLPGGGIEPPTRGFSIPRLKYGAVRQKSPRISIC